MLFKNWFKWYQEEKENGTFSEKFLDCDIPPCPGCGGMLSGSIQGPFVCHPCPDHLEPEAGFTRGGCGYSTEDRCV